MYGTMLGETNRKSGVHSLENSTRNFNDEAEWFVEAYFTPVIF
jgi:hypothetical protein